MLQPFLEQELLEHFTHLAIEQQRKVVDYARNLTLARVQGVAGRSLIEFAGAIDPEDLAVMAMTIENECEEINFDEW